MKHEDEQEDEGTQLREMTEQSETSNASAESNRSPPGMRVVGIGASAGGLGALKKLFAQVPDKPGVCFVVVVHLSPEHESHLAGLLQHHSRLPVQQVTGRMVMEPDHVYVIPPGVNIEAIDTHVSLSDMEPERENRAPIDYFFRTLAEAHKEQAVGVVLTGTGSDGTAGLRRIRERGGLTIVQSPEEAEHDGMPRSAIAAGVADLVLPIDQIPAHILMVEQAAPRDMPDEGRPLPDTADRTLQKILALVHAQTGHDFTHYKRATIIRRLRRRMQLHRIQHLEEYLNLLRERDDEVSLLFEDLLITVTEFFRDPEVFEHLESAVIPQLFQRKGSEDRLRVWSVGCATGEEAYSLAMLLLDEAARQHAKPEQVQIFATDLHEPALRKAREGVYPESIEADVSRERLDRFFDRQNGSYRVQRPIRERIVFALHNILQDPPFSRVQLISCRNLLIYLQRDAQQQLTTLFHYALAEDGYLLLGTAEAIDSDLFICEDKKRGIYRRRSVPSRNPQPSAFPLTTSQRSANDESAAAAPDGSYGALHEHVVEQYAPPSVLTNPDGDVVHYSARAGRFLQMPGGTPTNNLFDLLPEPLRLELRAAVHAARERQSGSRSRPILLTLDAEPRQVSLRVQPIDQPRMSGFLLVIFDELEQTDEGTPGAEGGHTDESARGLETELERTRKHMQAIIEEHESSKQRLQAYNEELESTNEELRSTMEELETSKEEMQSMNEELSTLNQENEQKVNELDQLSSDLHNLLTATHIATVFLDREMRILRFTPTMGKLFNVRDSDRGRSLADLTHRLGYEQLQEDFQQVLDQLAPVQREVADEDDRWYSVRLQPYRTNDDRIQGVVITFIDITDRVEAEREIYEAKELSEKIVDTVRNPMLVLDDDLRVRSANEAFQLYFGVHPAAVKGTLVYELNEGQWNIPRLRELLENILPSNNMIENFEIEHWFEQHGDRSLIFNARRIDHIQFVLLAIEDVTERKQARQALERSRDELERLVGKRTAQLQKQTVRLHALVSELSTAEQRERQRMAAVLHDELQQLLVSIKMQVSMARGERPDASVARAFGLALGQIDEAIDCTRTLVRQVAPQALYEEGLTPALHWLGEEMSRRHGLDVQIHADQAEPSLSNEIKTLLFDSIREMLFNVVKHANVSEAAVAVRHDDDRLHVSVSDAGVGFDVEAHVGRGEKSDYGVFSRGERIEALGGNWSIDSAPGKGTQIQISLPMDASASQLAADSPEKPAAPLSPRRDVAEQAAPIRLLVVDDHTLVRNGIVTILHNDPRVTVIAEAGNGVEAIEAVEQHRPDVVLMDINMSRMDGIEATRRILQEWPETVIIGLSMLGKDGQSARAMSDAGATAFLLKSDDASRLIETILGAARSPA